MATALLASQLILVAAASLPEPAQCWQVERLAETLQAFANLVRRDAAAEAKEYGIEPGLVAALTSFLGVALEVARGVEGACKSP